MESSLKSKLIIMKSLKFNSIELFTLFVLHWIRELSLLQNVFVSSIILLEISQIKKINRTLQFNWRYFKFLIQFDTSYFNEKDL